MRSLLGLLLLIVASCGGNTSSRLFDSSSKPGFDVNDVSILWPLPEKRENLTQLISLDGTGILSKENFDRLLNIAVFEDDPGYEFWRIKYWYIIGLRFDPCAKVLPSDATCDIELRLIAQPMMHFSDSALASDNALHLIYRLSEEQGRQVAKKLYELKTKNTAVSTNGVPLNIHPIMAAEGLEGEFAQGIQALVMEYAREGNIKEATAMLRLNSNDWRFARSLPNAAHELVTAPIPFVDNQTQTLFGERRKERQPGIFNEIRPAAKAGDSLHKAVDSDEAIGGFFKLPVAEQESLMQSALRIDNPSIHTPSTIDCVSCHMASRVLTRVKGREYLYKDDGNVDRYVSPMPMTMENITPSNELVMGYTVRGFGYGLFDARGAVLSQRVINDSARVASYLNAHFQ